MNSHCTRRALHCSLRKSEMRVMPLEQRRPSQVRSNCSSFALRKIHTRVRVYKRCEGRIYMRSRRERGRKREEEVRWL